MSEFLVSIRRSRNQVGNKSQKTPNDVLTDFIREVEKNPDVKIKDRSNPTLLVVDTTDDVMEMLKSRFGSQLIIEPNRALGMLQQG